MDTVFTWAGTHSLERELTAAPLADIAAGDLFIKGGFPGHAVLVADVAENRPPARRASCCCRASCRRQQMHRPEEPARMPTRSPWYPLDFGDRLRHPEWVFPRDSLRRWR